MSSRRRLLIILTVTLVSVGGAAGYTVSRIYEWHGKGSTAVFYLPDYSETQNGRSNPPSGEVLMTQGNTPADELLRPRDRILSIDGIPIRETQRLRALERRLKRGDSVVFRIERDKKQLDVRIGLISPLRTPYVLAKTIVAFCVAGVFIVVALLVVIRRTDDQRALVFFALALISALALIGSASMVYEGVGGRGIVPRFGISTITPILFFVVSTAYAPLILHLSLIFPREQPVLLRRPGLIRWIYAMAFLGAVICATVGYAIVLWLEDPSAFGTSSYRAGRTVGLTMMGLMIGGLALALQMIWVGRKEGVIAAFANRPFRATFALFGVFISAAYVIGLYGAEIIAVIVLIASMALPVAVIASYPIFACIALVHNYRAAGVEEKRQVQWPVWGLLIALCTRFASYAVQFVITIAVTVRYTTMMESRLFLQVLDVASTLAALAIPLSFAAAILKYRLMDIDLIIRRTVSYAILSGAIVAIYLALVGGLGTVLMNAFGVRNQTMVIASTLVVALMFVPLRNRLQKLVDRNLFRHKYDYPAALGAVSAETLTATDIGAFLSSAAEKVQQALQNRAVVMFVNRHEELVATAKVGVADSLLGTLRISHPTFLPHLDGPFDPRRHELPEDAAAALKRIEAVLVVPVNTPGTTTNGFVAAAPKLSNAPFEIEDIDFLRSVAGQLDLGIGRIRARREEVDFAQARAIQQTLLPQEMPRVEGLDVSGVWQPARMMGGDYYDLLQLSDTELAVCIGDVAGKGMPAALLMSGLQAAVRATASNSPRDLCERVRRVVVSSLSGGRFVTFFYATIDTAAMTLRWCNAGHNPPVLARADGSVVRLAEGGPAFSRLFRGATYDEREIGLAPGDRILLFTDGASEATDASGELLGELRLEELVAEHRTLSAHALKEKIVDAALSFSGGELEDDLTLVVVAVTQPA